MAYLYETHLHTRYASACGVARGRDYIPRYLEAGYTGIIVTEHFFGGNCAVDQRKPWREQVDDFCRGYEEAKNEGDKQGLQVFFGWEQNFGGDEYLVYGLDREWLYAHPEVKRYTRAEQYAAAHSRNGCVVQAHPFRDRDYIRRICLSTVCVDGVEVYNAANPIEVNVQAYHYARSLGLPMLAGTDIHDVGRRLPEHVSGVAFDTPLTDIYDFARRINEKQPFDMIAPLDELRTAKVSPVRLPVKVLGENDDLLEKDYRDFLR